MIRNKILFLFCLMVTSCNIHNEHKYRWPCNDLRRYELKGPVKSSEESIYSFDKATKRRQYRGKEITNFNIDGNVTNAQGYDSSGAIETNSVFKYDSSARLIERVTCQKNGDSIQVILKYDEGGRRAVSTGFKNGKLDGSRDVVIFTSKGYLLIDSSFVYDTLGMVTWIKYDEYHNELEQNYYHTITDGYSVTRQKFNRKGFPVEEATYHTRRLISTITSDYEGFDEKGNWLVCKQYIDGHPFLIMERKICYR